MKNDIQTAHINETFIDFDLRTLTLRCMELRGRILVFATLFSLLLFLLIFSIGCQYISEGFIHAPRNFSEYNAQKSAFWDRETLRRYLEERKKLEDPNGRYLLGALSDRFVQTHLQAVLPLSKEDLRYANDAKSVVGSIGILGFSIVFKSHSAVDAQARVQLMGDYIRDTMLNEDLLDTIYTKVSETKAKKQQIDNQIIQKRLALGQASMRLDAARSIASKYPEASKMEARQLLSTGNDKDSSRYLSPVAQLVGTETEIADLKSQLTLLERDAKQNSLRNEFYERMKQRSRQPMTGDALLAEFTRIGQSLFKDENLEDDRTREVYNQIMLIAEQMRAKHITDSRFVSGPTLPVSRSGPGPLALALLSLIGGVILAVTLTLLFDKVRSL